jgi:FkbM family methyltransferase
VKTIGERDVARLSGFGPKRLTARLLASRPVNPLARLIARRLAPAKRVHLPLAQRSVTYCQTAGPVTLLNPRADQVARDVYWGGGRPQSAADARTLRCVEALCAGGGTFLDIGSYSGLFAMAAARASSEVRSIAFEIVPENLLLIWRNVIANDLVEQVEPRLLGIGDKPGRMRMPAGFDFLALASSMSIGSVFDEGVTVPLSTLDREAANALGPLIMKIDVEGFEGAVLRGGRRTIERLRPDIICELLPDARDHAEIDAMLAPLGYRYFQSREEGFTASKRLVPGLDGRDWLLSCRSDVDELIQSL